MDEFKRAFCSLVLRNQLSQDFQCCRGLSCTRHSRDIKRRAWAPSFNAQLEVVGDLLPLCISTRQLLGNAVELQLVAGFVILIVERFFWLLCLIISVQHFLVIFIIILIVIRSSTRLLLIQKCFGLRPPRWSASFGSSSSRYLALNFYFAVVIWICILLDHADVFFFSWLFDDGVIASTSARLPSSSRILLAARCALLRTTFIALTIVRWLLLLLFLSSSTSCHRWAALAKLLLVTRGVVIGYSFLKWAASSSCDMFTITWLLIFKLASFVLASSLLWRVIRSICWILLSIFAKSSRIRFSQVLVTTGFNLDFSVTRLYDMSIPKWLNFGSICILLYIRVLW